MVRALALFLLQASRISRTTSHHVNYDGWNQAHDAHRDPGPEGRARRRTERGEKPHALLTACPDPASALFPTGREASRVWRKASSAKARSTEVNGAGKNEPRRAPSRNRVQAQATRHRAPMHRMRGAARCAREAKSDQPSHDRESIRGAKRT